MQLLTRFYGQINRHITYCKNVTSSSDSSAGTPNISSVDIVHATSLNNSGNYVFTAYVGTLSSTYTNISTMTTHSFFICPSLNTTTGSHNMMKFIYISRTDQNLLSGGNFPFFATLPSLGDPSSLSINQILHWKSGFVLMLLYQEGLQHWQRILIVQYQHLLQTKC